MALISNCAIISRGAAIYGLAQLVGLGFLAAFELKVAQGLKLKKISAKNVGPDKQFSSIDNRLRGRLNPNFKWSYTLSPERRKEVWTDKPQELSLQEGQGSAFVYTNLTYWMFSEGQNIIQALENNLKEKLVQGQFGAAYTDVHMVKCGNVTKRTKGAVPHTTEFHADYSGDALLPTVKLQRENILEELMYDKNNPTKWNEVVLPLQKRRYELLGIRNIWMPFHNVGGKISSDNRKELKAKPYDFEKLINELETEPEGRTQSSDSFSVKQAEEKLLRWSDSFSGDPFKGIRLNPFTFNKLPLDVSSRLQVDRATDDEFTTSADLSNDATDVNKNIKFHVFDPILFHKGSFTKKGVWNSTKGLASIELRCGIWKIK